VRLPTGFNLRLLGFVAVFSVGLGLRLASIRESLWLDELSTLWAVEASFAEVIRRVPQVMGQSPFYFAIVWASLHTFGQSELALRLPSLLAGMVCPTAIAMVASSLGGRRAAAWSWVVLWFC
jgi:mannosyltransferase